MNRKVISAAVAVAMTATMSSFALPANAAEVKTPQYQTNARQMEKLNRGLIAVKIGKQWRIKKEVLIKFSNPLAE